MTISHDSTTGSATPCSPICLIIEHLHRALAGLVDNLGKEDVAVHHGGDSCVVILTEVLARGLLHNLQSSIAVSNIKLRQAQENQGYEE